MDLELETELEELMAALSQSDLAREAEWEAASALSCPGHARLAVSGFPRYRFDVASLPKTEQQKLGTIAALIMSSYRPGCVPILQVDVIGHADRDLLRGRSFEHEISLRRALRFQRALQGLIAVPVRSRIAWQARGVGAQRLLIVSPKNEAQRARNRRLEIILSHTVSARYPVLVDVPGVGYSWTTVGPANLPRAGVAEFDLLTLPEPSPVFDSRQIPFKWICSLEMDFGFQPLPGGALGPRRVLRGSGTLISPQHVLTAGHCLVSQDPPSRDIFGNPVLSTSNAFSATVVPGRDGGKVPSLEPLGRLSATKFRVSPAWIQSNATNRAFDYGLITLDATVPLSYGFWSGGGKSRILSLADSAIEGKVARCSGYPARFCPPPDPATNLRCDDTNRGTVQFSMSGHVTAVHPEVIQTEMKVTHGQSGSPTWLTDNSGGLTLAGIASASAVSAPEVAVRVRSAMLSNLRTWMAQDRVTPSF
jgi:outer membrane protein OmpA-like peptidoglycan-associated protein